MMVTAGAAHADDRDDARLALAQFAASVDDATANGMFGNNNFFNAPGDCTRAVDTGTRAGLAPTDTFIDGSGNTVLWKRAPQICERYATLHALARTIDAIHPMLDTLRAYTEPDGTPIKSVTGDAYRQTVASVKPCLAIIDEAVKAGAPADVKFAPNANQGDTLLTLTDARKKCSDYLAFGAGAAAADDARVAQETAALRAKYAKLGIKGDRLAYLVKWGHRTILGKGCVELTGKALKTAPAFYDLGDDGVVWTVYKTQFKGDKQVKYTVQRFRRAGDYQCK